MLSALRCFSRRVRFLLCACLLVPLACAESSPPAPHPQPSGAAQHLTSSSPTPPLQLSGASQHLALWLDAADRTTLETDGQSNVSIWKDKSGRGHHALQNSAAAQPRVIQQALNGRPVVRFDGNDVLSMPDGTISTGNDSYTVLMTFRAAMVHDGGLLGAGPWSARANSMHFRLQRDGSLVNHWWGGDNVITPPGTIVGGQPYVVSVVYDSAYGKLGRRQLYLDGESQPRGETIQEERADIGAEGNRVGLAWNEFWRGDIAEVIVFHSALSDEDRRRVEHYLIEKWAPVAAPPRTAPAQRVGTAPPPAPVAAPPSSFPSAAPSPPVAVAAPPLSTPVASTPLPAPLAAQQGACDAGNLRSCVMLGEALYNGQGVNKDAARAVPFFRRACDAGEPTGCVDLGWAYLSGTGVTKDGTAAATQFGKACTASTAIGCFGLGVLYRDGTGVPRDPQRAAALLKQACDGGVPAACKM